MAQAALADGNYLAEFIENLLQWLRQFYDVA
jgi:hypothetical protein